MTTRNVDLVDTADIAAMLKLDRRYVTERLVKRDGFPAPVVDVGPKMKRWSKRAVLTWASPRHGR